MGFNVELGGYFSVKRNAMSIWGDTFLAQDQVVAYCKALLEVFRCGHMPRPEAQRMPCLCPADGCNGEAGRPASMFASCQGPCHAACEAALL